MSRNRSLWKDRAHKLTYFQDSGVESGSPWTLFLDISWLIRRAITTGIATTKNNRGTTKRNPTRVLSPEHNKNAARQTRRAIKSCDPFAGVPRLEADWLGFDWSLCIVCNLAVVGHWFPRISYESKSVCNMQLESHWQRQLISESKYHYFDFADRTISLCAAYSFFGRWIFS